MRRLLHYPRHVARLLLACFVLALGVATAAPMLRMPQLQRLCSASSEALWVVVDDGSSSTAAGHTLECPLCLPTLLAPPSARHWSPPALPALAVVRAPQAQHHRAPVSRAPFPPRAPPALGVT
ncbi:hypothetical protein GCM10022279_01560 [Comamonas faecalis]|uniref:DUF2946 domain-containing protein n=1 Tax=Comamonas faecalis TaxID=1387849 RepID=A0ABP7QFE6_9BURK